MNKYEPESEWLINRPEFAHLLGSFRENFSTYVDLGASHPTNKSLTSFCRDLGWRGLAIDGNMDYANDWAEAGYGHHFVCAVLSDKPTARFVVHDNSFTSRISASAENDHPEQWGIRRIEQRSTVPLNWLLNTHNIEKIDLLCVDLEGFEFDVLKTLDWEKHSPAWVIAEYMTAGQGVDVRLAEFLLGKRYEIVHLTGSNIIYRKK